MGCLLLLEFLGCHPEARLLKRSMDSGLKLVVVSGGGGGSCDRVAVMRMCWRCVLVVVVVVCQKINLEEATIHCYLEIQKQVQVMNEY